VDFDKLSNRILAFSNDSDFLYRTICWFGEVGYNSNGREYIDVLYTDEVSTSIGWMRLGSNFDTDDIVEVAPVYTNPQGTLIKRVFEYEPE